MEERMKQRKYIDARSAAAGDDSTPVQMPAKPARRPGIRTMLGSVHQHTPEGKKLAQEALKASQHFGYPPTQPATGRVYDIGLEHFRCIIDREPEVHDRRLPSFLREDYCLFGQVALLARPSSLPMTLGYVSRSDMKNINLVNPFDIYGSPDSKTMMLTRHSLNIASLLLDRETIGREGKYGFEGLTLGISVFAQRSESEQRILIGSSALFFPKDYRKKRMYFNFS